MLPLDGAPLDLGADEARQLAQQELLDPIYAQAQPPWWQSAVEWVLARLGDVLSSLASGVAGGGWLIIAGALLALGLFVSLRRTGVVRRTHGSEAALFVGRVRDAAEYRAASMRAAAAGDYHQAVLDRFRAIVRTLEQRGVIDERPGRTADEVAIETGHVRSELAAGLQQGAGAFDEVAYGGRSGSRDTYESLVRLDEAVKV